MNHFSPLAHLLCEKRKKSEYATANILVKVLIYTL